MSIANLFTPNTKSYMNLNVESVTANAFYVEGGVIDSFADNGNTLGNVGFPSAQPYNLYTIVVGKYAMCYFVIPPVIVTATSGAFNIPYPALATPPLGNVDNTTAFGPVSVIGSSHANSGTGILASASVGQNSITCFWNCGAVGTLQFRGSFVINLN